MPDPAEEAASQLRAIRALMERSTIYRAVSAPAALFAGVTCLAVCGILWSKRDTPEQPGPGTFLCIWLGVLLVASLVNTLLLYRSARARGEQFVSSGMKHALRALAPPMAAGFLLSLREALGRPAGAECYSCMVIQWMLFYGLALLATGSFSPRSVQALGAGFFLMGLAAFMPVPNDPGGTKYATSLVHMGFSFGGLHVFYAIAVWLHSRRENKPAPSAA